MTPSITKEQREEEMTIKNTTKRPNPEWLFGGNPGAIETQEAEGQKQLTASSQLPREMFGKSPDEVKNAYESLGVKVLRDSPNDDLFFDVELPEGWRVVADQGHSMWSSLQDANGNEVGAIFYKAAFYDRRATFSIRS